MKSPKRQFFLFLLLFFVVNVLQSAYTGLLEDEAYYWVWSNHLAWGYYDHPPMVAFFIWLGGLVFDGELGVRIVSALSFALMLVFMWKTIEDKEKENHVALFFLVVVSIVFLQVYGFISTPDTPLLLFTSVFFYFYKRFLQDDSIRNSLFLGFAMAALLYSKYHGILIIGFAVLSNLKILLNTRFWVAGIFGLALFIPHLIWQYENGFPTFVYHLKERGDDAYRFMFTLNQFINAVAVVGITFPVIYGAFWKKKATGPLEKSFKFTVFGFFLFFLFSSFRSQPQAQWLSAMLVPMAIFIFPYFIHHIKARKWLYRLGLAQLVLIIAARIFFVSPSLSPITLEPHLADTWVPQVKEKTGGSPLVFINSYQNASVYAFCTGIETHAFGIPDGRNSQYLLLDTESEMQGRSIYVVGKQLKKNQFLVNKNGLDLYSCRIDPFRTYEKMECLIEAESIEMTRGQEIRIPFKLINTYDEAIDFKNIRLKGVFQKRRKMAFEEIELSFPNLKSLKAGETKNLEAVFEVPAQLEEEKITFRIGASFEGLPAGLQGNKVLVNFTLNQ